MEQTEYSMVRPLLWSSALGYVIYMCHTGQAATLNRLLSWRYFVIFSKLSYAIYLTSVMTMVVFMASVDNNFPFRSKLSMLIDLNEMGVIFASSVFFTLIFVMPLRDIAPLIMGEKPPGSTKKEETIRRTDEDEGRSEKDETSKEECEKMGFDYLQKIK
ncbi:nose resistant to fluoxetine protein 6-like [Diaphorina citri]|uniref:Nose resistant to fluoxetine protein 6-like n=3 Tax=Diaphorina citri TaxID=121845 RepID=A0A1S3DI17_DIACI|nr:nose resistant to fluoxetine protein 6-like [Diaphorina citri]